MLSTIAPFFEIFGINSFSANTNLEGLSSPVTVLIWHLTGCSSSIVAKNISTAVKNAPSLSLFWLTAEGASTVPPTTKVCATGS